MSFRLEEANESDIDELMTWFPDAPSLDVWAGPKFRYPFTRKTFHKDSRWKDYLSYCLRNETSRVAAFGQMTFRYGRSHLARLAVHPAMRGEGLGRQLLASLIEKAEAEPGVTEVALFVYRENKPALHCYTAMGFSIDDYPRGARMADECYYMTRPLD